MTADHAKKRDIRALMASEGLTYTQAAEKLDRQAADAQARAASSRDDEDRIAELMDENEWTREEAIGFLDDPRNEILCDTCGWTNGMVCPECEKGCGCSRGCSGWRHQEGWGPDVDEEEDDGCPECGAGGGGDPYGECDCWAYEDDEPAADEVLV